MVLYRGLRQALEARDAGVPLAALNLGNIHPRPDSLCLTMSVYLTPEDGQLLRELAASDVALDARAVPADRSPDVGLWLAERDPC
jgi:mannose/fructose/N-acetylgalactosamine-specific phosphotransferase system component IIB